MKSVAIVGAGISGLHLALDLQRRGIPTTLYTDRSPEAMRQGRLLNNVCRFGQTLAREQALGVNHWEFPDFGMFCGHVRVRSNPALAFRGDLRIPASFVDFRVYLPRLLEDYADRGGTVEILNPIVEEIAKRASRHDFTVIATGGRSALELFPRVPERSPWIVPQRQIMAGFFVAVEFPRPLGLHLEIVPGAGEIFQTPVTTFSQRVCGITFEAVPGGPWDKAVRTRYDEDPARAAAVTLALLRAANSELAERVDPRRFALTRPLDLLQGAITPVVRRPWALLPNGRFVLALGDAAVLNDPVSGQGANLGARCARALAELIAEDLLLDERFCQAWEQRSWELSRDVTEWSNACLDPPPPHVLELFKEAAEEQRVADAFLNNFDDPGRMWRSICTPERCHAFLATLKNFERRDRCTTN